MFMVKILNNTWNQMEDSSLELPIKKRLSIRKNKGAGSEEDL